MSTTSTGDPLDSLPQPGRHPLLRAVNAVTAAAGSGHAIVAAILVLIVWAAAGPAAGFSDTWQLVVNTFTTLVTFVMVFVIQNAQNRDGRAIQVKLDEILEVLREADSRLVGIEDLSEDEIKQVQAQVRARASVPDEHGRVTSGSGGA